MPNKLVNMKIHEVSAVDKAANGKKFLIMKRDYSEEERKSMAASGEANPDGSFPIKTAQDVANAVRDWGRAGSKESDKKHIISRAKSIGAESELPDDWKGGEKEGMSKKLLKKFTDFLKGNYHYISTIDNDNDYTEGVQDFDTAYKNGVLGEQKDCELDGLIGALWTSIDSIVDDDSITDKHSMIITSVNQFMAALFSNETINKAGKKISKDRMEALKTMHQSLADLIAGASNGDGAEDDNANKGDGNMTDDEMKKRQEEINKRFETLEKRNETLEKRNQELEDQIKKSADETKVKEFIQKAADFDKLGVKADELGPILKSISEVNPEGYAKIEATLKAANEQIAKGALFAEVGSGNSGETDIEKRAEALAKDIQKRDGCTIEKARTLVYKENPDLYKEYLKENGGM